MRQEGRDGGPAWEQAGGSGAIAYSRDIAGAFAERAKDNGAGVAELWQIYVDGPSLNGGGVRQPNQPALVLARDKDDYDGDGNTTDTAATELMYDVRGTVVGHVWGEFDCGTGGDGPFPVDRMLYPGRPPPGYPVCTQLSGLVDSVSVNTISLVSFTGPTPVDDQFNGYRLAIDPGEGVTGTIITDTVAVYDGETLVSLDLTLSSAEGVSAGEPVEVWPPTLSVASVASSGGQTVLTMTETSDTDTLIGLCAIVLGENTPAFGISGNTGTTITLGSLNTGITAGDELFLLRRSPKNDINYGFDGMWDIGQPVTCGGVPYNVPDILIDVETIPPSEEATTGGRARGAGSGWICGVGEQKMNPDKMTSDWGETWPEPTAEELARHREEVAKAIEREKTNPTPPRPWIDLAGRNALRNRLTGRIEEEAQEERELESFLQHVEVVKRLFLAQAQVNAAAPAPFAESPTDARSKFNQMLADIGVGLFLRWAVDAALDLAGAWDIVAGIENKDPVAMLIAAAGLIPGVGGIIAKVVGIARRAIKAGRAVSRGVRAGRAGSRGGSHIDDALRTGCFVAGTGVWCLVPAAATDEIPAEGLRIELGGLNYIAAPRAIEDIRPGDLVLSRSNYGTDDALCAAVVDDTYDLIVDATLELELEDRRTGARETVRTTGNHPIWVESTNGKLFPLADVNAPDDGTSSYVEVAAPQARTNGRGAQALRGRDAEATAEVEGRLVAQARDDLLAIDLSRRRASGDPDDDTVAARVMVSRGWAHAESLQPGYRVTSATGRTLVVADVRLVRERVAVYNFTVVGTHTYFVAECALWVHNAACDRPVQRWETGAVNDLRRRSPKGDRLEIHHAPQANPARQVIPGYNPNTAPGIAVPEVLHRTRLNPRSIRGVYTGTPQQLMRTAIRDLRAAGAPEASLRRLRSLWRQTWPGLFR